MPDFCARDTVRSRTAEVAAGRGGMLAGMVDEIDADPTARDLLRRRAAGHGRRSRRWARSPCSSRRQAGRTTRGPSIDATIEISSDDVRRVLDRQRELEVPQSIEWVDQVTPGLAETVESMGIAVARCPLLVLDGPPRGAAAGRHA